MELIQLSKRKLYYENAKHLAFQRNARIPTLKELIKIMEETVIERDNGTSIKGRLAFIEQHKDYLPCFTSTFARVDVLDISTYGREIRMDVWNDGENGFRMTVLNNPSLEENFLNEPQYGLPVLAERGRGYLMAFNSVSGFYGPIHFHPYAPVIASGINSDEPVAVLGVR